MMKTMKTYYIWLKAVDDAEDWFGEYEFYDTVEGTPEDLEEALKSWNNDESVIVLGVTE